ncbi:sterol O-acyltransferase 2, partial [Scheffersomyces xylosifermentans]|uniref:sterol O-acyltransferase 2 n=1 Tax=Scheffersomyces xylosifermentans TaxID=1304137 RepID=UPI00315D3A7C
DKHKHKFVSEFGDIKFHKTSSTIFDASYIKESEFFGFYVLFWLGTAFFMLSNLVHIYFEHSVSFLEWPVVKILTKDVFKVGLTDLGMYLSIYVVYFIQVACEKRWISWSKQGWIIQSIYEVFHLSFWLVFASARVMNFPWIAKVFLVLHSLVFLMKMHSYGFYNGYLWKILKELRFAESYLKQLEVDGKALPEGHDLEDTKTLLKSSIEFCKFELEFQSNATTVSKEEYEFDEKRISWSLQKLQYNNIIRFPQNINIHNFFEYTMFPTVVYTLNYPRTERIRWSYVFAKIAAIFGIIFLMIAVAQKWMYPLVLECIEVRKLPFSQRFVKYLFILLDMIPPFLMEYLFTFFLIWDSILNAIAELSRFADREFYGAWWSCTDWSEFSRIWNVPVHKFLLRHVYHSSISAFHFNKMQATLMTFILSSVIHELVMYVIFENLRGYLLLLQMSQIPLVMISRTKYMRDKKVLGNVICWFGFISGPSMVCTLYLVY